MAPVTIKTIAERLNLHPSTVSRALGGHPNVRPKTREKVLALANELDYQPNILAKSLKERHTRTIGVIVPEIRHYFFSCAISAIDNRARENGYAMILCQSAEQLRNEVMNVSVLEQQRVAGMIVSISQETISSDHLKSYQRRGGILVLFDRVSADLVASKVINDNLEGAYMATEHLIARGYRRIAHLAGPKDLPLTQEREKGYRKAMQDFNQPVIDDWVVYGGMHERDGMEDMDTLLELKEAPDAIFTVNDPVAVGAYESIKAHGLEVGTDIGVVGFSNNPTTEIITPSMTTVEQYPGDMGKRAIECLIEQIRARRNEEEYAPETVVVKTEIIERASTCRTA